MTIEVTSYREFDDVTYSKFRRSLIARASKGSKLQRMFLEKVRETSTFLEFIRSQVAFTDGIDLSPLADQMSEFEFKDPPSDTEQRLFSNWHTLTPRIACRTTFWARVTFRHIEEGRLESFYLAGSGGNLNGGLERIDAVLSSEDGNASELIDRCVRTVLRRLGGLPEARGNRTVYVNCPLSRAWWRERLVAEATQCSPDIVDSVREVTHVSQEYWEQLVTFVVSRNSVFGSPRVRNALVARLGRELCSDVRSPLGRAKDLTRICRSLSAVQASLELSILPQIEIEAIVDEIITMHLVGVQSSETRSQSFKLNQEVNAMASEESIDG